MTQELGKIEKPEASQFKGKRKLYLIPLVFKWDDAPIEYMVKFNAYWEQVKEHLTNLESKLGKVSHIYHESIDSAGEDALTMLKEAYPVVHEIASEKQQNGGKFEATEDKELLEETMDWERHLLVGFISEKVAKIVSDFFVETSRKRWEYIARRIDETLKEGEAGLLFIRESHGVQFASDIEVFSIAPPALDEIQRWIRDRSARPKTDEGETK